MILQLQSIRSYSALTLDVPVNSAQTQINPVNRRQQRLVSAFSSNVNDYVSGAEFDVPPAREGRAELPVQPAAGTPPAAMIR